MCREICEICRGWRWISHDICRFLPRVQSVEDTILYDSQYSDKKKKNPPLAKRAHGKRKASTVNISPLAIFPTEQDPTGNHLVQDALSFPTEYK